MPKANNLPRSKQAAVQPKVHRPAKAFPPESPLALETAAVLPQKCLALGRENAQKPTPAGAPRHLGREESRGLHEVEQGPHDSSPLGWEALRYYGGSMSKA